MALFLGSFLGSRPKEKNADATALLRRALAKLNRTNGSDGRMTLLVVDEIDRLVTTRMYELYNLFEWATRPGTRLAVIGISNTHDFESRVIPRMAR